MHLAHKISVLIERRAPCYEDSDDEEDVEPSDYAHNYPVSIQSKHDGLSNGIEKPTTQDRPKFSFLKTSSKTLQK